MIITLTKDTDPSIATRAIRTIPHLSEDAQDTAFTALDDLSITSKDENIVAAICEAMDQRVKHPMWNPIPFMTLFLQKCVSFPELSEQKQYRLCSFLKKYRWQYPHIVANFFLDRVRHRRTLPGEQQKEYRATSYILLHPTPEERLVDEQHHIKERYEALCAIRDGLLVSEEGEIVTIFAFLAHGYDATALRALSEWLESGEEQKVCLVAKLIQEAPTTFVLDNEAFVERLLSIAAMISKDVSKQMSNALLSSAMPFALVGIPDLLSNERVQIRDRARQTADKYPSKSAMHEFYMDLSKEADYRIEMQHSFLNEQNQPKQVIVA